MGDITIVTVNWHSAEWIRRLLRNLLQKSSGHHRLRCLIHDNTNGIDAEAGGFAAEDIACSISPINSQGLTGSRAHALALNKAMEIVQTEFVLIVDPDVHVFAQGWDSLCVDALSGQNAWAIGAPYPRWKVGKYHKFPSPVFCLFRRELAARIPLDWRPYSNSFLCNAGVFAGRQIGRLGGLSSRRAYEQSSIVRGYSKTAEYLLGTFSPDTGWRISNAARRRKLASVVFDDILPQNAAGLDVPLDPIWNELAREFELFAFHGRLMLVHRYGTRGRPWKTAKGGDEAFWHSSIDKAERLLPVASESRSPGYE